MDVEYSQVDGKINILFNRDKNDGSLQSKNKHGFRHNYVKITNEFSLDDIHFDHLALSATMLIANPFIGEEVSIPFPMSVRDFLTQQKGLQIQNNYQRIITLIRMNREITQTWIVFFWRG